MRTDKGITLISLIVTVVILIILSSIAIGTGTNSIKNMKLQGFNYELQQVQGKVDAIYEKIKLGQTEYIILGSNITESTEAMQTLKTVKNIDYSNIAEEDRENYYYEETNTTYRYLTEAEVKENLNISSDPGDMIINFINKEVISVEGFEDDDTTYYRLDDFDNMYISTGNALDNMVDLAYRLLPKEYQQVEYIESTGTQYIDTGSSVYGTTKIELDMHLTSHANDQKFFGGYNGANGICFGLLSDKWRLGGGTWVDNSIEADYDNKVKIIAHEKKWKINDTEKILSTSITTYNSHIYVFGVNYQGSLFQKSSFILYSLKIYDDGINISKNFIPCYCITTVTNVDGVTCPKGTIGLYDTVEGKFYTNKGEGTFSKGEDV